MRRRDHSRPSWPGTGTAGYAGEVTPARRPTPPPLEANDQLVTAVITAGWAIALAVTLILRQQISPGQRWWIWTCVAGLVMGLFGLWYVPRLKRSRARKAARRAEPRGKSAVVE